MSWSLDIVEGWVEQALIRLGYTQNQATLGAHSVTWLQQRNAPGVAALAQHIDFLSAYKLAPMHGEKADTEAVCPIVLAESLQADELKNPQTFHAVRQPLLLIPTLSKTSGSLRWNDTEHPVSGAALNIEHDRKTLRTVLVEKAALYWSPTPDVPKISPINTLAEIPSRELVYIKTIQHYAGTLPPREPLDGASTGFCLADPLS